MRLLPALRVPPTPDKPIIALTGAGGKSTLLFCLGQELAETGRQVLLTTTTRLWRRQMDQAPFALVAANPALLADELAVSLRSYGQVLAVAGPASEPAKMQGLAPDLICRLADLPEVKAVVVEADGSRERPFKAPAAHEPVTPGCATAVLSVASLAVLDRPLADPWVHRPQLAARLASVEPGAPVTPEIMARVLSHPMGGLKGVPPRARASLYLNLGFAGDEEALVPRLDAARRVAGMALAARGFASVLIGRAGGGEDAVLEAHGRVAAIILAAGESRRFGPDQVKQLLPWGSDNTLLGHVVDTALAAQAVNRVVVVVGHEAESVRAALGHRPADVALNTAWRKGQSSSVRAGLDAAQRLLPHLESAVFLLADMPDVHPSTIDALVEAHRGSLAPIVAPRYRGGVLGNPVLFDCATFPELQSLEGDVGGRPLIERYGDAVRYVTVDQPRPQGLDTPEAYHARRSGP